MSFDLQLTFLGLCAFTPREAIPSSAEQPHLTPAVRVLLPNVVNGVAVSERLGVPSICSHEPQLTVDDFGEEKTVQLRGHDIKISDVAASAPSIINAGQQMEGLLLHTTFWRLADIGRLRDDFVVDDKFFDKSPPDAVVARLQLTAADVFGRNINPMSITFPANPPYTGNFAREVRAVIRITGEEGRFEITKFGSADPPQVVTFRPASQGGIVTATISNLCDQDPAFIEDHDFAAFALLQPDPSEPLPLPGPTFQPSGGPGEVRAEASETGPSSCIPAVTPPNGLA